MHSCCPVLASLPIRHCCASPGANAELPAGYERGPGISDFALAFPLPEINVLLSFFYQTFNPRWPSQPKLKVLTFRNVLLTVLGAFLCFTSDILFHFLFLYVFFCIYYIFLHLWYYIIFHSIEPNFYEILEICGLFIFVLLTKYALYFYWF